MHIANLGVFIVEGLYKSNRLYNTIDLFCKIRGIKPSAMCAIAGVSAGIVSDLKFGRKQSIQIETASKIAKALGTTVSALEGNTINVGKWDMDTVLMWNGCQSDDERRFLLKEFGADPSILCQEKNKLFVDSLIMQAATPEQKIEAPAFSEEDERKTIEAILNSLSREELLDLMAKTAEKLKERGLG